MKHALFSVFDEKAAAYLPPFTFAQKGQAIRAFTDTLADENSQIAKHPEDYTLFELGAYDDATGLIDPHPTPQVIGKAIEFMTP